MVRILGIDPGSRTTGFGIIHIEGTHSRHVISGCVRTDLNQPLAQRLGTIFSTLHKLIDDHRPQEIAVEQVFMHRNADAALKLGQARGVAICVAALADLPVSEYAPRAVKQAVVGYGGAAKEQVQHMVCALLELDERLQADAADALAVALCHGHARALCRYLGAADGGRGLPALARRGRRR